ncbi:regulatory protein RecX [Beutenbergia cavernae DSM 12333]|uniref:Regulatory protein RecX n=1 Tax=Beutenbergia cavernae (strain ATCC BAA-8 / DSM 12333 / CCUG 43141 / JCM 11478 / NBRC 16432 / NCIMB 13614 / HKI 0122) TaxID=471853 RepID=C5BWN1_BEUC1|nr:regulatory protein RecX [Beutenbergia cavernae]ACQ80697.1 regulatory protein RecX [Beutenbergia cavernae DSM 12333]
MAGRPGRRSRLGQEPPRAGAAAVDAEPDPESVARSIALRLLTGAPRSRAQLAEAMARKDVPDDVATRVLDRFTEVGLVDDAEFAAMLVRTRHAERGLARRALALELARKGIDREIAEEALAGVDDEDEEAAAVALVRRRAPASRGLEREKRRRRLVGMLARKGHSPSVALRVVDAVLAEERDGDPA